MKIFLHNPSHGAPIKNWYDGTERWSLAVNEIKAFPDKTALALREIFAFLEEVSEQEFEVKLSLLNEKEAKPTKVKVDLASGELVPKSDAELEVEMAKIKKEKEKAKTVLAKVKKAPDAEPETPDYSEMSRGEVFAEVSKRGIEIKGLGKGRVSKEQLISLLINDDNT